MHLQRGIDIIVRGWRYFLGYRTESDSLRGIVVVVGGVGHDDTLDWVGISKWRRIISISMSHLPIKDSLAVNMLWWANTRYQGSDIAEAAEVAESELRGSAKEQTRRELGISTGVFFGRKK